MMSRVPAPSQITLREVGPRLRAALEREARKRGLSLNRTALALLAEATGLSSPGTRQVELHHELDALAGTWSEEDAEEFDAQLSAMRDVDPGLWR